MTNAPAISSIISPEYVAEFVINQYHLNRKTTCGILKIGINHTYVITTPDIKYVFRIYFLNWRTQLEIDEELKLLNFLKENEVLVSYPILDSNNKYLQTINAPEGERFAVLFSFAEGETIRIPTKETCYNLGVSIAKMHQSTVNKTIKRDYFNDETLANWAYNRAKNRFVNTSNEMHYYKRANAKVSFEFNNVDSSKLRSGIVHLDLWYENMKVSNESKITFFDFDNCGNGWLFLDISYTLMILFRNEADKENFKIKRESFYKGYESITPISKEEKRLIPYGGLAIWLYYNGIQVERFNDFSNQFLSEDFLKYWIHTVTQWMEFNNIEI